MTQAIIYAARSTEDKRGSIATQVEDCRQMAQREGWAIAGIYSDEGFSAYSGNRGPGLAQAREAAVGKVLVCQHSDRLARGAGDSPQAAEHLAEIVFWARRHNVELRSVQDDSTFTNPLLAFAMGERNYEDSRRKGLSVKSGMKRGAARGKRMGGPRIYGYTKDLVPIEQEVAIIQRIFEAFVAGQSLSAIARALHQDRVPTRKGGLWDPSTVKGTLTQVAYIGKLRYDGEVYDSSHSPVIDADLWGKAHSLLEARPSKGRGRPSTALFRAGFLRCGACQSAMTPTTRSDGLKLYRCNGASKLGKDHCAMPELRREDIDSKVLDYLLNVAVDVEATRKQLEQHTNSLRAAGNSLLHQAERAAAQLHIGLDKIKRDYTLGNLPASEYVELKQDLEVQLAGAVGELERLKEQQANSLSHLANWDMEQQVLEHLAAIRKAIKGEFAVSHRESNVDAVRATMQRLFLRFEVHVPGVSTPGNLGRIIAIVRDDAVQTVDEQLRPILAPQALDLQPGPEGNSGYGWPLPGFSSGLFGPIRF